LLFILKAIAILNLILDSFAKRGQTGRLVLFSNERTTGGKTETPGQTIQTWEDQRANV